GNLLLARRQAQYAIPHYHEVLRSNPESSRGHFGLGGGSPPATGLAPFHTFKKLPPARTLQPASKRLRYSDNSERKGSFRTCHRAFASSNASNRSPAKVRSRRPQSWPAAGHGGRRQETPRTPHARRPRRRGRERDSQASSAGEPRAPHATALFRPEASIRKGSGHTADVDRTGCEMVGPLELLSTCASRGAPGPKAGLGAQ